MKPLWITGYDETFRPMAESHFLDSFEKLGLHGEFELELHDLGREYGTFGDLTMFNKSYTRELHAVTQVLRRHEGRLVVWSDVDMRFYRSPLLDILSTYKDCDLFTSMDSPYGAPTLNHCTGFQYFRVTPRILSFYQDWRDLNDSQVWDNAQVSFNETIRRARHLQVAGLPPRYWTIGLATGAVWDGRSLDDIPSPPIDIVMHHANYTIGVGNKMRLLDEVKRRMS